MQLTSPRSPSELGSQISFALYTDVRGGGEKATEQLYAMVVRLVRNFTRRAQTWGADPDDLLHDIFVAVYRAIHSGSIRHPDRLHRFIVATAQRQVSESLRTHLRHPAQPLDDGAPLPHHTPDPEDQLARQETRKRVESLLATLPKIDQTILRSFYFGEIPWQTIAADLQLSPTQFRLRKCRALARIRGLARDRGKPVCR